MALLALLLWQLRDSPTGTTASSPESSPNGEASAQGQEALPEPPAKRDGKAAHELLAESTVTTLKQMGYDESFCQEVAQSYATMEESRSSLRRDLYQRRISLTEFKKRLAGVAKTAEDAIRLQLGEYYAFFHQNTADARSLWFVEKYAE